MQALHDPVSIPWGIVLSSGSALDSVVPTSYALVLARPWCPLPRGLGHCHAITCGGPNMREALYNAPPPLWLAPFAL